MQPMNRYFVLASVCLVLLVRGSYAQVSPIANDAELKKLGFAFSLADGAAWDGSWALYIPDVRDQKLYRYIPRTGKRQEVLKDAGRISATFFQHGRLYLSDNGNQTIAFLHGGKKEVVFDFKTIDPKLRPNDLVVDNDGGIYVTFTPQNQVLYIDRTGKHHVAIQGIRTPNGITLAPDGKTLYVSAFVPKEIWSYPINRPGLTGDGKKFATLPKSEGRGADGIAIDRAGNVYCTGPTGVTIWSPSGKMLARIETPSKPINCTFADQDMQTLYISCFDGVYSIRTRISGKAPQPPIDDRPTTGQSKNRPPTRIPESITPHLDIPYATHNDRKLLMDLFVPENARNAPAVLVVHGGGWLKGDKTKFRALALRLAQEGFVSAAVEYRLGGEARFPAGIQDCLSAVQFLRSHAEEYRLNPDRIGAVGGSAGGHLVGLMAAAYDNPRLISGTAYPEQSARISVAVVMAGPMQMVTGSVAERSRSGNNSNSNVWIGQTVDRARDLYLLADAYEQFSARTPPILFMCGEHDNPERNSLSRKKLRSLGVWTALKVYKGGKHGCWNQNPWFETMAKDMASFLHEKLK